MLSDKIWQIVQVKKKTLNFHIFIKFQLLQNLSYNQLRLPLLMNFCLDFKILINCIYEAKVVIFLKIHAFYA